MAGPMTCPEPPDMNDCKSRKKRCLSGECVGFAYTEGNECGPGAVFNPDTCMCEGGDSYDIHIVIVRRARVTFLGTQCIPGFPCLGPSGTWSCSPAGNPPQSYTNVRNFRTWSEGSSDVTDCGSHPVCTQNCCGLAAGERAGSTIVTRGLTYIKSDGDSVEQIAEGFVGMEGTNSNSLDRRRYENHLIKLTAYNRRTGETTVYVDEDGNAFDYCTEAETWDYTIR